MVYWAGKIKVALVTSRVYSGGVEVTMVCNKCGDAKPATLEFFFKNTHCNALRQPCKTCWPKQHAATNRVWRLANRDRCRDWALQRLGDFTLADYNKLKKIQGGVCAICGGVGTSKRPNLVPDHNHLNGRLRGLLCTPCNVFLGRLEKAGPKLLMSFLDYIMRRENGAPEVYGRTKASI